MESQWYGRRVKPRKPSQRQLVQLSLLYPSLADPSSGNNFRSYPEVKSKLAGIENEKVDPPLVNRSLKTLVKVKYYQKEILDKHSEIPGRNATYLESGYLLALKELVAKSNPRCVIYDNLNASGILKRYLTILQYVDLLRRKHIDVQETLKVRGARGIVEQHADLELYRQDYVDDQIILKDKTNRQIVTVAERFAGQDLKNKSLNDSTYTKFFIAGGICYGEIELSLKR